LNIFQFPAMSTDAASYGCARAVSRERSLASQDDLARRGLVSPDQPIQRICDDDVVAAAAVDRIDVSIERQHPVVAGASDDEICAGRDRVAGNAIEQVPRWPRLARVDDVVPRAGPQEVGVAAADEPVVSRAAVDKVPADAP
jgi:hypothetical protein